MKEENVRQIQKIFCILSFIFIILCLTSIAISPKSTGYEISIYNALPIYFWIFMIGAVFLGTITMLSELFINGKSKTWYFGLLAILITNYFFLLLPLFRGYPFSGQMGSDLLTHLGWMKEIMQSGMIADNFYPITHVFTVIFSGTIGLSLNQIIWFIPPFFSSLFVIFVLILAKTITDNKKETILITLFATPLIFSGLHYSVTPSFFSFIFIPLLLYLYYKRNLSLMKIEFTSLIILLCFLIVYFHPITTLIAIIIFLTFIVVNFLLKKLKTYVYNAKDNISPHKATNIVLILIVSFLAWYTSHGEGLWAIKSISESFITGSDSTIAGEYISIFGTANLNILQTLRILFLRYGALLFYMLLGFIALLIVGKRFLFSKKIRKLEFTYSAQLIISFFVAIVMMFSYFIITNPIRSMKFFLFISTIFNGLVFYSLIKKHNKKILLKKIIISFIASIILITSFICIISEYSSPIIWQPNRQITYEIYEGSTWFVEYRDTRIPDRNDFATSVMRIEHYINGVNEGNLRIDHISKEIPSHFGYDENDSLYDIFNQKTTYMVTTENARQAVNAFPDNIKEKVTQFTDSDFIKLNSDKTVNKIFENGEYECYYIRN